MYFNNISAKMGEEKTLDTKVWVSFLVFPLLVILFMCYMSLLGELSAVIATLLGEVNWKVEPGVSWTPLCNFFFADFKLCMFVLNHNGKYTAFLSS